MPPPMPWMDNFNCFTMYVSYFPRLPLTLAINGNIIPASGSAQQVPSTSGLLFKYQGSSAQDRKDNIHTKLDGQGKINRK